VAAVRAARTCCFEIVGVGIETKLDEMYRLV
jgi:hypothetical protein